MSERPKVAPASVRSLSYATCDEIKELGQECRQRGVSADTRFMLANLATMPPTIRLAANLRAVVGQMIRGPIRSVLTEGLTPAEHTALVELDLRGVSERLRGVAHGLLNVHERVRSMREHRRTFRDALDVNDRFISPLENTDESDSTDRSTGSKVSGTEKRGGNLSGDSTPSDGL